MSSAIITSVAVTGIIGLMIITIGETLHRLGLLKGEFARKFIHILIAVFASTWAHYLSWQMIVAICLLLIIVVIIVAQYSFLRSIKAVHRVTLGEVWYPAGIALVAILFRDPVVYSLAILHMGLADGFAAVVGVGLGRRAIRFKLNDATKSVAGTLTFFLISFILYSVYWTGHAEGSYFFYNTMPAVVLSATSAFLVAIVELVAPNGSDNLLVPFSAGLLAFLPTATFFL